MFAIIGSTPGGDGLSSRTKLLGVYESESYANSVAEDLRTETQELADQLPAWASQSGVYSHITVQPVPKTV